MFEVVIYAIVFLWLLIASIFDIKTREVPDWLNFSLIAVGVATRGIFSIISKDYWIFIYGIIGFGIAFALAMLMYYAKQWGGGDSKILLGIGILLGFNLNFSFADIMSWPIFLTFFVNTFIVGAIVGLIYSIFLMFRHWKEFKNEIAKNKLMWLPLLLGSGITLVGFLFGGIIAFFLVLFGMSIIIGYYLLIFVKAIEKSAMYKYVDVKSLVEGDWVAKEVKINNKVICSPKDIGLEKKQIALLKRHKIKKVLVKEGIPFVPSFLLSFTLTLLAGNLFLSIFGLF